MRRNIFVDRETELQQLERLLREPGFTLVFVYGRRRIGKTRLLSHFASGKTSVYYVAAEIPYESMCREFAESVKRSLGLPFSGDILEVMVGIAKSIKKQVIIVIDEFQYAVDVDQSLPSRLQRLIDSELSDKNIMLILCGSAVSFFERRLLAYKSPLFGRRKASIRVRPLGIHQIGGFLPRYGPVELLRVYATVGGTPAYLECLSDKKSFEENLRNVITPGSFLYDEALNILRQEVREPRTYQTILFSVANGKTSQSQIASAAHIDPRSIVKYIELLEELEIITRVRPLGYRKPVRLRFKDNYFRFWFTYTHQLRTLLETGYVDEALSHILETFDNYLSRVFEDLVEELAPLLHHHRIVETRPIQVGRWWHKNTEIDVVIRDPGKSATFIEAKWSRISRKEAERILSELEEKAAKTGLSSPENHYLLIAKQLTGGEKTTLEKHRRAIDLKTLEKVIKPPIKAEK